MNPDRVGSLPFQEDRVDLRGAELVHGCESVREELFALLVGGARVGEVLGGLFLLVAAKTFAVRDVARSVDGGEVTLDRAAEHRVELVLDGECFGLLQMREGLLEVARHAGADAHLLLRDADIPRGCIEVRGSAEEDLVGRFGVVVLQQGAALHEEVDEGRFFDHYSSNGIVSWMDRVLWSGNAVVGDRC